MRSQTIYQNNVKVSGSKMKIRNRGFMIVEVMLAFSIFTIFTISIFSLDLSMQRLKIWSLNELDRMELLVRDFDRGIYASSTMYGNSTMRYSNRIFTLAHSNYSDAWGRGTCYPRLSFDPGHVKEYTTGINTGVGNYSSDIEVRHDVVYLSTDSSNVSLPDLYIVDNSDADIPRILSSLHTGPGIRSIEVAGPYVFVAQASTANQLQIVDISDRTNPKLISQLRLPLPTPTTTPPIATSIFYYRNHIYLGTTKWNGPELSIINVSDKKFPFVVGSYETGTLVNDIYATGDTVYLATSDEMQMRVLDVKDKSQPRLIDSFTSSGWQTQEGKTINMFEDRLMFGRTVGGFNVTSNHEVFVLGTSTISKDIPGGVYGILQTPSDLLLLTHATGKELQVYDPSLLNLKQSYPLVGSVVKMACDNSRLYFATGDMKGFLMIDLK
jgi:hypothetical protein